MWEATQTSGEEVRSSVPPQQLAANPFSFPNIRNTKLRYLLVSTIYAVSYILLEKLTVNPQLSNGPSVWYPPAGLTFALLLIGGIRYLPVIALTLATSEYINLGTPYFSWFGLYSSILTATGYTLGSIWLRAKLAHTESVKAVQSVAHYVIAAGGSALFVAMAGTATLAISLGHGWANYWPFVFHWWLGDGVAVLCITPFLLLIFGFPDLRRLLASSIPRNHQTRWMSRKGMEISAQAIGLLFIFAILFVSPLPRQTDLFYLFFLPVIWIALIHGLPGVIIAVFALNVGLIALFPSTIFTADVIIKVHILQLAITVAGMFLGASINEREAVRDELSRRTTYFQELVSNNPIATVVLGPNGDFQMCNPAFEQLFQFKSPELFGKIVDEALAPEEVNSEVSTLAMRAADGEHIREVTRRRRKDGTVLDVEAHGVPLWVSGRLIGVLVLYADLTEKKLLESQLLLSGKLQAVGRLAGGVAHDFNNIIGVMQGYAELLAERLSSDLKEYAEEIVHSSKRATGLTRQLLVFSRKQVLELRIMNLNTVVNDFKTMLLRLIPEDIEQVVQLDHHLGFIKADKGQLEQIIMNLAVNARDAMPQGGALTIETYNVVIDQAQASLHLGARPGTYAVLSVTDTGTGMNAETKAMIFEPFFSTKDKDKGTGLGLATVYGIVNHSGGFITVDTSVGLGSTFRIHFPLVEEEILPIMEAPKNQISSSTQLGGNETILIAEDEDALREMARIGLERAGYTVLEARDGTHAIEIAQTFEGEIALLLSDVIMPKLRGPQAAKYISFLRPEIKTIFMSGYTDGAMESIDHSASEPPPFLYKPFSRNDLLAKIREVLSTSEHPQTIP
jgi:PAS domain S-box-containing protein